MNPARLKECRRRLEALLQEALGTGPSRIEPNRTSDERAGGDEDSQPLNEMLQAIASQRNASLSQLVARAQRALGQLNDQPDEYGLCGECGEEIAWGRLQAMPYAERCVACQGRQDTPRGLPTRKKLTDFR